MSLPESSSKSAEALALELKELALRAGVKIGTAESCTGGLIAGAVTSVPGSSAYFYGAIVSYDNSVKMRVLGVPSAVLDSVGAVSSQCAAAMARGAAERLGVDLAVSVTGIAGPDGGSAEKPVGTVWFGLCDRGRLRTEVKIFPGSRAEVRARTVCHALELLCDALRS
jgi:PncC family amidohydrolase